MKICIYGAGAVGGQLGARLIAGGADISIVERGEQLAALRDKGLRLETTERVLHSHPTVTDRPDTLGPQDVVIVAIKAPFLPSAMTGIGPLLGSNTAVVFMLNGIPWWYFQSHGGPLDDKPLPALDPDGVLQSKIDPARVVGAVAYTASVVLAPGVVRAGNKRNRVILGRPDGRADPLLTELASFMEAGGLETSVTPRIRDAIWQKLVMNLIGGSLGIVTASAMGDALALPAIEAVASAAAHEASRVASALGCDAGDIEDGLARLKTSTHKQSILQDLELGRPMEVDALIAVPVELARMAGIETPNLDLITQLAIRRAVSAGLYQG